MHARLKRVGVVLLCLLLLGSACDADQKDPPQKPAENAIEVFKPADVPDGSSGSLVATLDGEVVTCAGWGQGGCETVYDIGSVSKQFTAAAVVKLQMQGRLRVTDPIGRFFDGVPVDKRGITVRHLLTHTAGLLDALGDDYDPLTREAMIAGVLSSELRTRPGERYHYSNVGYSMLAAIVEKVSGMGYEDYLAQELLSPAGMTQTGYVLPDWDRRGRRRVRRQGPAAGPPVRASMGRGRPLLEPSRQRRVALHRPGHGPVAPGSRGRRRAGRSGAQGAVPAEGAGGAGRGDPLRLRLGCR